MISLDRSYKKIIIIINLLFVLPGLHLNILKTEGNVAILGQKWHVILAPEVNHLRWQLIADHNE